MPNSNKTDDTGAVFLSAIAFAVFSWSALYLSANSDMKKEAFIKQTIREAHRIADDSYLHHSYGNNNGIFENEEAFGIAKDIGLVVKDIKELGFEDALKYVKLYKAAQSKDYKLLAQQNQ